MTDLLDGYVLDGCLPDEQDLQMPQLVKIDDVQLPSMVDLRQHCSPVEDQAKTGSCVANAIVGALEYHQIRNGAAMKDLSRLFVYYNARRLGDRIGQSGTTIGRAMASILGWGVCPAAMWPYQVTLVDQRPTQDCYEAAQNMKGVQIAQIGWNEGCKEALANRLPIAFAMRVSRPDFAEAARTGILRPPNGGKWAEAGGGHAMLMVGYDDSKNAWLVRNSWGSQWGAGGYVWIDYDFLDHYRSGENYRDPPFVIGQIQDHRSYQIAGVTMQDFVAGVMAKTSPQARVEMDQLRSQLSNELESSLSQAKKSIRDRLRS